MDPNRRETEHLQKWPNGYLHIVGGPMSEAKNTARRRLKFVDLCAGREGQMCVPPRFWSDTWRASP